MTHSMTHSNYDSLGLVIQEYGYRGQAGQPTMQRKTVRGRPQ